MMPCQHLEVGVPVISDRVEPALDCASHATGCQNSCVDKSVIYSTTAAVAARPVSGSARLGASTWLAGADDLIEGRKRLLHRLFNDPSCPVSEVMIEMNGLTERCVLSRLEPQRDLAAWAGGSLGRREMLPNSDLDLFLISSDESRPPPRFHINGLDRVETANLSIKRLKSLSETLIDLNQFVDGRPLWSGAAADAVAEILTTANTYDRQHANLVAEHFYFRHFDFSNKRSRHGPNVKYSSGSSRVTLFFNFFSRIFSGTMPASRGNGPEFLQGVRAAEQVLGVPPPYRALEVIQVVKNAAISTFDATKDIRQRYLSRESLEMMFDVCHRRLVGQGFNDRYRFPDDYRSARREVEAAVLAVVEGTLGRHRSAGVLRELGRARTAHVPTMCAAAADEVADDAATLLAFGTWNMLVRPDVQVEHVDEMARALLARPLRDVAGAVMALACGDSTSGDTFRQLLDWATDQTAGSYLFKLVARNQTAPRDLRAHALERYTDTEVVHEQ